MIDDPIVSEVRKARNEYAKRFNYDLDAICKDLQQKQSQSGKKVVSFPPKRPKDRRRNKCRLSLRERTRLSRSERRQSDRY